MKIFSNRAFTLIETLVAITVLLISLVGPLTLAAQALKSAYYARDEVTAFYLAQEGLEYVRAVRDQNYLANPQEPWLTGITDCVSASCNVDFLNFSHTLCPNGVCPALLIDQNGFFNTQSGTPSNFTRTLTLTPITGMPDEMESSVTISWTSAGINRSFQVSEYLFNWL